jgi:type IV pilus assembly protein PilM
MDEKSVWKKEISFRRKPKASKVEAPDDARESVWKKQVSFKRKPKPVVAETKAVAETKPSIWRREITLGRKKTVQPDSVPEVAIEPVEPRREPAVAQETEPALAQDPALAPTPEPTLQQSVAKAEPPETGDSEPEAETAEMWPPQIESVVPEHIRAPEHIHVPEPVEHLVEPVVQEPVAPVAEPAPVVVEATQHVPASPIVHPPVPAAELPPLPDGPTDKPTPFWRREVVLGRRGPAKPKDVAPVEDAPKAEKPKRQKTPKAPKAPKAPKIKVDRGGRGKKIVGLKIGASQLAAARVTNNGAAELLQVAREPLSPGIVVGGELRDPDALAVALKDFFNKYKLPKRGVRLGIANNRIGVRTFEIGGIDDAKQLENAIRFRAQEALPIPIDEAVMDYHVLGETTDAEGQQLKRVLLVVAYREQIDRYIDACKKAGITLLGIDLEAFALLRALQAPQSGAGDDPAAALVAVAVGHERSTFAVSDGRVCEFTRVLEWGGHALNVSIARALDAAPSEVEAVKRNLSLNDETVPEGLTAEQAGKARDAVQRAIQAFARELVSSLQFYQNQPGSLGIGEIVLTGGTAHLPGLASELERLIGVHVRVGDPLARIKVSKRVGEPEQLGSYSVAIGLGIED